MTWLPGPAVRNGLVAPGRVPVVRLELAAQPDAARHARAHARDVCARWHVPREVAADAELVVSEFVTNACIHATVPERNQARHAAAKLPPPRALVLLTMGLEPRRLMMRVWDGDGAPPVERWAAEMDEGGRGLGIVHALTGGDCGWRYEDVGKTVWGALRWEHVPAQHGWAAPWANRFLPRAA